MEFLVDGDDVIPSDITNGFLSPFAAPYHPAVSALPAPAGIPPASSGRASGKRFRSRSPSPCSVSPPRGQSAAFSMPKGYKKYNSELQSDASSYSSGNGGNQGNGADKKERNRLSAVRYRKRKKQYMDALEEQVQNLTKEVSEKEVQIASLAVENTQLRDQLSFVRQLLRFAGKSERLMDVKGEAEGLGSSSSPYDENFDEHKEDTEVKPTPVRSKKPKGLVLMALFAVMFVVTGLNLVSDSNHFIDPISHLGLLDQGWFNQNWLDLAKYGIVQSADPPTDSFSRLKRTLMSVDFDASPFSPDTFGESKETFAFDGHVDYDDILLAGGLSTSDEYDDFAARFIEENFKSGDLESKDGRERTPYFEKNFTAPDVLGAETIGVTLKGVVNLASKMIGNRTVDKDSVAPLVQELLHALSAAQDVFSAQ